LDRIQIIKKENDMIEKKFKIIGLVGLVTPPILYFLFLGINSTALSTMGLSANGGLVGVSIISLLIWVWSSNYARSQNKFFKKREEGDFKVLFGINSVGMSVQVVLWLFVNSSMGSSNVWGGLALLIVTMFILGNVVRIWLTSKIFSIEIKTSINSLKIVLIEEIVLHGLVVFLLLKMSGTL
jgi:hypothetical protein|tara:strand:+ start:253 stop:798 length:546 start_codon:yes stop_codon:yes gene_type:complete